MMRGVKQKRNRVPGILIYACLAFSLVACGTSEDKTDGVLPENTPAAVEPAGTGMDTGGNSPEIEAAAPNADSDLIEIYLAGEMAEGIDPWDNENLDALEPVGEPILTAEQFTGYYEKCDREHYPDPAAYGEIVPGENSDRGRLYYNLGNKCAEMFYENFEKVGGEEGGQYGVLIMSRGEKLMCAIFDTGSGLATPQNAQIGLSLSNDEIFLCGGYGECNFGTIMAGVLPGELYFTAEELRETYDRLAQSYPLSDILALAHTVTLGSGMRDEITFSEAQTGDLSGLLKSAQYAGRSFALSEGQQEQRGPSVMSLDVTSGNGDGGHAYISLYEDMKTIDVTVYRENRWVHFDRAYYDAPELIRYMDDLSQDGMPKLFALTNITEVKVVKNGETQKVVDEADTLDAIEKGLSDCRRTPLMNLHGSEYEIIVTADGIEYTMRPDDNINDALIFDGHQYQAPAALLKLLEVY